MMQTTSILKLSNKEQSMASIGVGGGHCQFWLPKKKRFCANTPLHNSCFCGNHSQRSDDQWIPCPIDPSHSVLQQNLENHLRRCPFLKQAQSLSLKPYYQNGINAGTDDHQHDATSEMKRHAVYHVPLPQFFDLLAKIKTIHATVCNHLQYSFKIPQVCAAISTNNRQVDRYPAIPFQEKHVLQQASILGNLEEFGILQKSALDVPAVVEFGAGRGYLTQMLADCYGIKKVLLVERKSYKLKADRSLRQIEGLTLERLRIDIEDLNLNAVESLQGVPYLAIGKHLCGPAADMTLRCCISQQCDLHHADESKTRCSLKGLAIATCCHHLCQWKHYINKKYMSNLGLTKEDFHAVTWFTSWAVDADHGSDLYGINGSRNLKLIEKEELGPDFNHSGVGDVVRNMSGTDRAVLGFMCKDIIDAGRWMWLKEHGLHSQIVEYVPASISPENHLLIATQGS
ncbi:hypothetical protein ACH5RR_010883 [Cinchona calisaya]|uniref:tRNA:m(4)X modification enzyme TRM13 n=1 Tax=Cinchona calisaya TaxID=153742 RepID=A0ABD3AKD1_9GENT